MYPITAWTYLQLCERLQQLEDLSLYPDLVVVSSQLIEQIIKQHLACEINVQRKYWDKTHHRWVELPLVRGPGTRLPGLSRAALPAEPCRDRLVQRVCPSRQGAATDGPLCRARSAPRRQAGSGRYPRGHRDLGAGPCLKCKMAPRPVLMSAYASTTTLCSTRALVILSSRPIGFPQPDARRWSPVRLRRIHPAPGDGRLQSPDRTLAAD